MQKIAITMTLVALGAVGLTFASTARAADPYGTAGCGLGSILFGDQKGIIQVLAATTNGTFGSQTFGITSGTSNCVDTGPSAQSAQAFVEGNREALAKDISRGQGETIASLSTLAGCSDAGQVGSTLQSEFKTIFPNSSVTDTQVSASVLETLRKHPELACTHAS